MENIIDIDFVKLFIFGFNIILGVIALCLLCKISSKKYLFGRLSSKISEYNSLSKRIEGFKEDINRIRKNIEIKSSRLCILEEKIKNSENQFKPIGKKLNSKNSAVLEKQEKKYQANPKQLKENIFSTEVNFYRLVYEIKELKIEFRHLNKKIVKSKYEKRELYDELMRVNKIFFSIKQRLNDLRVEVKKLKNQLESVDESFKNEKYKNKIENETEKKLKAEYFNEQLELVDESLKNRKYKDKIKEIIEDYFTEEYVNDEKDKLFKGFYPIESLLKGFLQNFRRYWYCIILLYLCLVIQFCFDKKHEKKIHLKAKITTYVNSKSKKRVEWKKEYKNEIFKPGSLNIKSVKDSIQQKRDTVIFNSIKVKTFLSLRNLENKSINANVDSIFSNIGIENIDSIKINSIKAQIYRVLNKSDKVEIDSFKSLIEKGIDSIKTMINPKSSGGLVERRLNILSRYDTIDVKSKRDSIKNTYNKNVGYNQDSLSIYTLLELSYDSLKILIPMRKIDSLSNFTLIDTINIYSVKIDKKKLDKYIDKKVDKILSQNIDSLKSRRLNLKISPYDAFKEDSLLQIEKRVVNRYSDDLSKSVFNCLTNSVNTLSGLFLYLCYLALLLSTQERDDKKHIEISRSYKNGGIYIFIGLIFIDFLVSIIDFYSAIDHKRLLQFLSYFSGLASSFTVFLLAGKLDSKLLKVGKYYFLIVFLYVYGAIQPLFFVFSEGSDEAIATLMGVALALKISLLFLFCHLLNSNKLLFFVYELRYLYNTQKEEFKKMTALKKQYYKKSE